MEEKGFVNVQTTPLLGRMLSPDNYIQAPDYTQNLNRYSYCFNNPLKYTDPTGNLGEGLLPWAYMLFGNYAINVADNVINKGMPFGKALRASTVSVSANYSPSMNTISNYQVDAYTSAAHLVEYARDLDQEINEIRSSYYAKSEGMELYWYSVGGSIWDVYNNFGYNHTSYLTTKGTMKPFSDFAGRAMSKQASKYFSRSVKVKSFGNLGTGLMAGQAIINIYNEDRSVLNAVDGVVGVTGLTNAALLKWSSVGSTAIGPFVAIYGFGRLLYDFVAVPNIGQIQNNIMNNKNPLNGVYNPATGMYD